MNIKKLKEKTIFISFALYILLLTWIIVFKFRIDLSSLKYIRSINLIPFKANGTINGMKETLINIILFIPMGMYLQIIIKNKFTYKLIIIITISLIFELLQYILHIGVSDITDIIMNLTGGIVGMFPIIIIYKIFSKKFSTHQIDKTLGYLSLIGIISIIGLILFI